MGWQTQSVIQLFAGNTIINPNGSFTYSSAPAAGNLIASIAPTSGLDTFGNNVLQGVSAYGSTFASSLNGGFLTLYSGSLAAGWTAEATIQTDVSGDIVLTPALGHAVITTNNTLDDGAGNATFGGTVAVNALTVGGSGSTATAGLPDGTIHGTSGAASAGTAHTHSPGSFAVGNGVHQHAF